MDIVFLIASLIPAVGGLYLLGDFLLWRLRGRVVPARIKALQDKKNKGLKLPLVVFKDETGQAHEAKIERIEQFLFLFNRPQEGAPTTIIYRNDNPQRARIYGYIHVVAGLFLLMPFLFILALNAQNNVAVVQLSYLAVFGVIILGGWAVLKLIQRG